MDNITSQLKYTQRRYKQPEMTYILGSRCTDGVVLVADKKFTIEDGTAYQYDNKLFGDVEENLVIGFSGSKSTFDLFRNDIIDYVTDYNNTHGQKPSIEKIISEISNITFKLDNRYHRTAAFDVLLAISGKKLLGKPSLLHYFYQDGRMETVRQYRAIGNGTPYGSIILKQNWREDLTMKQVAELGYFIIKYIETFDLDLTVGVDIKNPQIWFIPDSQDSYGANDELLVKLETSTNKRIEYLKENNPFKLL